MLGCRPFVNYLRSLLLLALLGPKYFLLAELPLFEHLRKEQGYNADVIREAQLNAIEIVGLISKISYQSAEEVEREFDKLRGLKIHFLNQEFLLNKLSGLMLGDFDYGDKVRRFAMQLMVTLFSHAHTDLERLILERIASPLSPSYYLFNPSKSEILFWDGLNAVSALERIEREYHGSMEIGGNKRFIVDNLLSATRLPEDRLIAQRMDSIAENAFDALLKILERTDSIRERLHILRGLSQTLRKSTNSALRETFRLGLVRARLSEVERAVVHETLGVPQLIPVGRKRTLSTLVRGCFL